MARIRLHYFASRYEIEPTVKDGQGRTPTDVARQYGNSDILKILQESTLSL